MGIVTVLGRCIMAKKVNWHPGMPEWRAKQLKKQGRLLMSDDYDINGNLKGSTPSQPKQHPMMGWRVWAQKGPAGAIGVNPGTNGIGPDVSPEQGEVDIEKWERAGYAVERHYSTVDINDPKTGRRVANYDMIFDHR